MAVAETRLRVVLVDEATAQLLKMNKAMSSLSSSLQGAGTSGVGAYTKQLDNLNASVKRIEKSTSSYMGALTKLTGLYKTLSTFGNMLGEAFGGTYDYYKSMQSNAVGISGILTSMTKLNGKTVEWNTSMGASQAIMERMRKEALQTASTSQDLIETFRGILGPGLSQGMNIEQLIEFTKVGVNAVKSMGLPSNQYLQELRSILQGNIRASSSTLATALGITNQDVKNASASADGLFKFLMDRMKGFGRATGETTKTLAGQLEILKESYQNVGAQVYDGLFKSYSKTIAEINDLLLIDGADGKKALNQDFIDNVRVVGDVLDTAFSRIVANTKIAMEHWQVVGGIALTMFGLPKAMEAMSTTFKSIASAGVALKGLFNGGFSKAYDEERSIAIQREKASVMKSQAEAQLKLLDAVNAEISREEIIAKHKKDIHNLTQKHKEQLLNVNTIMTTLKKGGVELTEALKRGVEYMNAIDKGNTQKAERMLQAITTKGAEIVKTGEEAKRSIDLSHNSFEKFATVTEKFATVTEKVTGGLSKLTGALSTASFAVLMFSDENDTATRAMAEGLIAIDMTVSAFSGLVGVLKEATAWWNALELAQKSAYISMAGAGAVVAVGASFIGGAIYKGYNDYNNYKNGGKAVIDGDSVRFEAPESTFTPEELRALEKSALANTDDDDYDERPDYILNKLKYGFDMPTDVGGGSKTGGKGKTTEEITASYNKLIDAIKSSKENAIDFGNAYQKAMAGANKQVSSWQETLAKIKKSGLLTEEDIKQAETLMNEYTELMKRKATEAERSEKLGVLKSKIGQADNVMLFGGSQEEQYKRKKEALTEYRDYLNTILNDSNLNIQQRIAYEQQYADAVKQIRQNDMHDFSSAWKATLQDLAQQQIDYSEGIRTIYSEFLNFGQNLIGSTQTVTERLRDLVKNLVNDILNMMMKIYMQQIMMGLVGGLFGGGAKVGGGGISTTPNIAGFSYKGGGIGVPGMATGGLANGWTIVGERGPELVNFSNPGRVYTADQTRNALSGNGGGVNIKIDLHNESGQQMQAETTGSKFDGESYVVGVVLKAISTNKNGMRNIIKGVATT